MKVWKKLSLILVAALVIVAVIVVVNTLRLTDTRQPVEPITDIAIDPHRAAERLAGAIRYRTVSYEDHRRIDAEPFRAFHTYLEGSFPRVHEVLGKEVVGGLSLLYRWQGRRSDLEPVLLMAHQDVVPVESQSEGEWSFPPFAGDVVEGYVRGRGSLDDKAGLMGILEAVELLLEVGFEPERTVYVAFGHDEEIGGWEGARRISELLASRNLRLAYVLDEGGMITQGVMPGVQMPVALIGIAEKGSANLALRVRVPGGHSSVQQESTAIGILARAISRIEEHAPEPRLEVATRAMLRSLGAQLPFPQRMIGANLWLFEPLVTGLMGRGPSGATIRTTVAPTMIRAGVKPNVLPTEAEAVVNVRILTGGTAEGVLEYFRKVVDDPRVELGLEGRAVDPSPVSRMDTPAYAMIGRSILEAAQIEDLVIAPFLMIGGTDAKHFTGLSEGVYRFLGAKITQENLRRVHGIDERISVRGYERVVRIYYQVLRNTNSL